jgi:hypothetical protein
MSRRKWTILIGLWLLSLMAVGTVAQSKAVTPLSEPITLSGADIAFRVEGTQGNTPVGKLIVRYKGRWVEPRSALEPITLASQ